MRTTSNRYSALTAAAMRTLFRTAAALRAVCSAVFQTGAALRAVSKCTARAMANGCCILLAATQFRMLAALALHLSSDCAALQCSAFEKISCAALASPSLQLNECSLRSHCTLLAPAALRAILRRSNGCPAALALRLRRYFDSPRYLPNSSLRSPVC